MAQGQGSGYDLSQSSSDSTTQGFNKRLGNFSVGGGIKIPEWATGATVVALVLAGAFFLYGRLFKKKR